jgi:hypothetical protein
VKPKRDIEGILGGRAEGLVVSCYFAALLFTAILNMPVVDLLQRVLGEDWCY